MPSIRLARPTQVGGDSHRENGADLVQDLERASESSETVHDQPTTPPVEPAEQNKETSKEEVPWAQDPANPYNWTSKKKNLQLLWFCSMAFLCSVATSILSPATAEIMAEFHVSRTVALLPLSLYVLSMGFGPVLGGPLSETLGRYPVYIGMLPIGVLFTLGAGFTHNFGALCFLRFMAGFTWGPIVAIGPGSINETYLPAFRGPASAIYVLMPFLGPGFGPVIGSFVVNRKDWRWTQWTIIFMAIFSMLLIPLGAETFAPILKRRLAKARGQPLAPQPALSVRIKKFTQVALIRPIVMLLAEPIVTFLSLYVAVNFGTLFCFFAAVPYTFSLTYDFHIEQTGLVFISIVIGCVLGFVTLIICDIFFYRKQIPLFPPNKVPPEHRLYAAMIGSLGLPVGLFWFAWSARSSISWANPAAAIIPFAWGNLCIFVSAVSYMVDTYSGDVIASAAAANSLARYGLAAGFPLFTIQMYEKLGIHWAGSLLAFLSVGLLPIPWILFKFGPSIRAKSKYETASYD